MILSWLMPMQWSPEDDAGADDDNKPDGEKPDGDKPPETGGGNEENGDSPKISAETAAMLKAAGVDPDAISELDQGLIDQIVNLGEKGAGYRDKLRETEKAEKKKESLDRAKRLELAKANLISDDGKLDKKALTTLTEQASKAEGFQTLFDAMIATGHISEMAATVISKSKSPEIAAAVLEQLPAETVDRAAEIADAAKKLIGVNSGDRGAGGGSTRGEDEAEKMAKETEANLSSIMARERELPAKRR